MGPVQILGEVAQMRKTFLSLVSAAIVIGSLIVLALSSGAYFVGPGL